jgi:hypothetical protein
MRDQNAGCTKDPKKKKKTENCEKKMRTMKSYINLSFTYSSPLFFFGDMDSQSEKL